jgi:surface antigen
MKIPLSSARASAFTVALVLAIAPAAADATTQHVKASSATTHHGKATTAKRHAKKKRKNDDHAQAYRGSRASAKKHARTVRIPKAGKGGPGDPGDDYPPKLKSPAKDAVVDQWGMFNRECTSFVAWALSSRNGFDIPFHANANKWGPEAAKRGFAVNSTPAVGSVAWSNAGTYGHVAYVQEVIGDQVRIEEYNFGRRGAYGTRTVPASSFTGYIHFRDVQMVDTPAPAPAPTPTPAPAPAPATVPEISGGVVNTWSNYTNAGGTHGPSVPRNATVQIACKLQGFKVADGNTWWYRIAQDPWNGQFYASADAFFNNGMTTGSLKGTPWVDPAVPDC